MTSHADQPLPYAAIVLAGGTGRRLGGLDKAAVHHRGRSLLDGLLEVLDDAADVVVVGPARATGRPVTWTREDPPGGGPGAGVLAGFDALTALTAGRTPTTAGSSYEHVAVVAVDMAHVDRSTLARLLDAAARGGHDGSILVGPDGRRQLCAVVRTGALEGARPAGSAEGIAVHRLLDGLGLVEVPARGQEATDVDTPEDLERLRQADRSEQG